MVIDKQLEGLTDMSGNFLDIYLDENNNSFSNIDNLSATTYQLPKPTFFFEASSTTSRIDLKSMEEQRMKNEEDNFKSKNSHLKSDLNKDKQKQHYEQLTKRSVKRALFVNKTEIDHEANLDLVSKQMEQLEKQDCEKWNFDFKNNCPLNNQNSQYEWFINDSILSNLTNLDTNNLSNNDKLNLKIKQISSSSTSTSSSDPTSSLSTSTSIKNEKQISSSSSSSKFEMLLRNSTNTISNNTRSVKRRLNLNDYFQPAKKRANAPSQTNQKPTDQILSSLNNTCKFVEIKKLNVDTRSTKFQKPTNSKQVSSKQDLRKARSQRRQQQKNQKTQKDKKQTTLKFIA